MRFMLKPKFDDPRTKFHNWFAWHPVIIHHGYVDGMGMTARSIVWLETVERRMYQGVIWGEGMQNFWKYIYRLKKCAE